MQVLGPEGQPIQVKLQIWDTAGAEMYRSLTKLYYQKAAVIIFVYSMNDYESLEQLTHWVDQSEQSAENNV